MSLRQSKFSESLGCPWLSFGCWSRPEFCRRQPGQGALLDRSRQWTAGPFLLVAILMVASDKKLMQRQPSSQFGLTAV